ncbi:sensor histidine kinase [Paenibacillus sp. SGZ-1009]|uniref:sensor histidine kinase n=1 Tax=Paenibacillus campi TaxID=3106031 RepID=UPI002AFEE50C|nr:histidine kinase [Paenibacillus sp. SGZ-1009]
MLHVLRKWNTLRNQVLFVFLSVMVIVLLVVSVLTFRPISSMLQANTEHQIQQVAVEATGRFDSLYEQVNMVSKLVTTNRNVQNVLQRKYYNNEVSFKDRQELKGIVNTIQANSDGISSFELYTKQLERVLPLDGVSPSGRLTDEWIARADEAGGRLVWIGDDPTDKNYFLAIRRVNLMEQHYTSGGYLLVSMYRYYFQFANQQLASEADQYSILLGRQLETISSNYGGSLTAIIDHPQQMPIVELEGQQYIMARQPSTVTGWTVLILTPVSALYESIHVLRNGIVYAGVIGIVIYFICSYFLSTLITKPILRLTDTMQQAIAGPLTLNPNIHTVNEINELNSTYNQLVKETNHLIKMVYEKEITRNRSELKALQAQINPHFLFNALDALRWSLEEKDQEELAEQVVTMSNLFRYTITRQSDEEWVLLRDEIRHIDNYMEIMKMRFGERLHYEVLLSPAAAQVRIPRLLIQPLVENAVLHGAGNKKGACTITICAQPDVQYSQLHIVVQDDGPGMTEQTLEKVQRSMENGGFYAHIGTDRNEQATRSEANGKGIALSNVYQRLQLYFPEQEGSRIHIQSEPNVGTCISLEIPFHTADVRHG